jgi:hypothetical protein
MKLARNGLVLIGVLLTSLLTPMAASATVPVSADLTYSGEAVELSSGDCATVLMPLTVRTATPGQTWSVDVYGTDDLSGTYEGGSGSTTRRIDVDVCWSHGDANPVTLSVDMVVDRDYSMSESTSFSKTIKVPVKVPATVSMRKVSSSHLSGLVRHAGNAESSIVTVWVKAPGHENFARFGKARIAGNGKWHLHKQLKYGAYRAVIGKSKPTASASSSVVRVKKPAAPKKSSTKTAPTSTYGDASAICRDGTLSYSAHRQGTCSWHGGVQIWL